MLRFHSLHWYFEDRWERINKENQRISILITLFILFSFGPFLKAHSPNLSLWPLFSLKNLNSRTLQLRLIIIFVSLGFTPLLLDIIEFDPNHHLLIEKDARAVKGTLNYNQMNPKSHLDDLFLRVMFLSISSNSES